jgi:hypothetical protein
MLAPSGRFVPSVLHPLGMFLHLGYGAGIPLGDALPLGAMVQCVISGVTITVKSVAW